MKYVDQWQGSVINFWNIFPIFKDVKSFKKLFTEDRSKDKNRSSKIMWYLVLTKDIDSEFYDMEDREQREILSDVLGMDIIKALGEEGLVSKSEEFENFIDTPLSGDVRALEKKMLERKNFIMDTPYSVDEMVQPETEKIDEEGNSYMIYGKPYLKKGTAAQLDKMVTDTKKLHEEIRSLREALKSEQTEKGKGGRKASFLEG